MPRVITGDRRRRTDAKAPRTPAQIRAARENIKKAQAARWAGKRRKRRVPLAERTVI